MPPTQPSDSSPGNRILCCVVGLTGESDTGPAAVRLLDYPRQVHPVVVTAARPLPEESPAVKIVEKLLRAGEGRILKKLDNLAAQVNAIEEDFEKLTDAELRAETDVFKKRLADGETLDDILPEAFAAVREASKRTLGKRHFDVQIMGGAALHMGNVAEMRTGEGKTLVATLPSYLNALTGKGVHVITVNDYLAEYQSELMGRVHRFLGLETGCILASMTPEQRRAEYAKDITYGTNNEFGFDYLRDNMAWSGRRARAARAQLRHRRRGRLDPHRRGAHAAHHLRPGRRSRPSGTSSSRRSPPAWSAASSSPAAATTRSTRRSAPSACSRAASRRSRTTSASTTSTSRPTPRSSATSTTPSRPRSCSSATRTTSCINGEVLIVDEHTGRMLAGRRYNEGMHQAIEAKEGVEIKNENQTLATITLQNYFRMYDKLSGMTGTAQTEAAELNSIYKLGVVPIPTNRPMIRRDQADLVYRTEEAKYDAVVDDIVERHEKGQPVLVGTVSVEKSEYLSEQLRRRGVKHEVLNAKHHEREAAIVADAGRKGAVTVATNMAGRGTDIMLGGNPEFRAVQDLKARGLDPEETPEEYEAAWDDAYRRGREGRRGRARRGQELLGGLYVLGTERHESPPHRQPAARSFRSSG
jgi:preprotein translocase subunit SecA